MVYVHKSLIAYMYVYVRATIRTRMFPVQVRANPFQAVQAYPHLEPPVGLDTSRVVRRNAGPTRQSNPTSGTTTSAAAG